MESIFCLLVLLGIVSGFYSSKLASEKGYDTTLWFLGGLFFNIIALIAIAGLPVKNVEQEKFNSDQKRIEKAIRETGKKSNL